MTSRTQVDIAQMRDQVFFEAPERTRRLSRFWLLLYAVIASAGDPAPRPAVHAPAG